MTISESTRRVRLAVALVLATTPAVAQRFELPTTVKLTAKNGAVVGTVTFSRDGRFYLRDGKGGFIATIVVNADGSKTAYDYSGKVIDVPDVDLPR